MNHINLFLVLVIILVVLLFVLVILLVTFRESFGNKCCRGRRGSNPTSVATNRHGLRNPAFDVHEHPVEVIQRPFSNMEATESPPSYEEAVKQELFRFRSPTSLKTRSNSLGDVVVSSDRDSPSTSFAAEASVADSSSATRPNTHSNQPSTSQSSHSSRSRSSTANSSCLASSLSTIEEESEESSPVTVVIDCIGIQASRLMENCETSVDLAGGCELATHSKC